MNFIKDRISSFGDLPICNLVKERGFFIGEFCFPKAVKLFILYYHIFFLFIFYQFASAIGIFIIVIIMPMILIDLSIPKRVKMYREVVLCKIEHNLKNENVNIRSVKRYNFFNK